MFREAFSFARSGDSVLKTLLVGGVVNLAAALLVVPGVFVYGYLLRVLRVSATGGRELPPFDDWTGLFVDGLKAFLVVFVYLLVPTLAAVFLGPILGVFVLPMGSAAPPSAAAFLPVVAVFAALLLVGLPFYYVLPAALVGLATQDSIDAAFDLGALRRVAFTKEYFLGVLGMLAVWLLSVLVATPLAIVLVGFVLQFYFFVAAFHVVGRSVRRAATTA